MTFAKHFVIFYSLAMSIFIAYIHDEDNNFINSKVFFSCFLMFMSVHIFHTLNDILSEIKKQKGE